MSTPQPNLSTYAHHNDDDVLMFEDRDHCCNDLIAKHKRSHQDISEKILSLVKVLAKEEEDTFRLSMTNILESKSMESKVKSESGELNNRHEMTAPKLLQQFGQMHVEDRSSDPPLEIHEEQNHNRVDPYNGNNGRKKKKKKKRTRVLDAGETINDDQQVNRGKKRSRGVVEGHSSLSSNDMTGLNRDPKRGRKNKEKERKREWNEVGARNSTQPRKISNEGNPRTSERVNIKERKRVIRDQDHLDTENGQHHHKETKPTSKPEWTEKQSSKGKERMIEDGKHVNENGIPTPMATEPEQVSSSNDESEVLSQSRSIKYCGKTSDSKKHKESGLKSEMRDARLANKERLNKQVNPCRASTPYTDTFADEDDENMELSSPISNRKRCNNYIDLESFVPNTSADEDEDANIKVTSSHQLDSSMLNSRQGACRIKRSHTVPPRIVNVESHSEARNAQNPTIGFDTTSLPTFKSSLFTAAATHSKETLVGANPSST
ncbi:MAG: hypothetical protein LQ342_006601 [Letrouitia transgressa]|nr:MAG: hypothetical protein LQ342_006601 [Letrouitia transgressa]